MKTRIIIILILLACAACQKNAPASAKEKAQKATNVDMGYFNSLSTEAKVSYINALKVDLRGEFLMKFLPGAVFGSPPNEAIKFLDNGEIIISSVGQHPGDFQIAYWKVVNNKLHIWKTKDALPFPEQKNEIWNDLSVKEGSESFPDRMYFFFKLPDKTETSLIYRKHNEYNTAFDFYEKYLKTGKK
ncbi:MAG TPA: hypothetical protein P5295_15625 [Spirochaetota bacterium]|nr:hypothetical protein [Spirochaetota bacterium]